MKKLLTLAGMASIGAVLALLAACETTGTSQANPRKEALLAQSGFRVITVTTTRQQQAVNGIPQGRVSAVKYNGRLFYVYPTATKDRIYVGRQKQFNAYKHALASAQQASQPASQPGQPGQQLIQGQSLEPTLETAGPEHIAVQQFDGFGPMGTAAMGDW